MEKIGRQVFLYDFYGELLTEHQKRVYEDVVLNDMSLSEIAEELGISRQGVHDLVKRCDKILAGYEEKLHLVERFWKTKEDVSKIRDLSLHYNKDCIAQTMEKSIRFPDGFGGIISMAFDSLSENCKMYLKPAQQGPADRGRCESCLKEVKMALLEADVNFKW